VAGESQHGWRIEYYYIKPSLQFMGDISKAIGHEKCGRIRYFGSGGYVE
jgi:hypothetical protein